MHSQLPTYFFSIIHMLKCVYITYLHIFIYSFPKIHYQIKPIKQTFHTAIEILMIPEIHLLMAFKLIVIIDSDF